LPADGGNRSLAMQEQLPADGGNRSLAMQEQLPADGGNRSLAMQEQLPADSGAQQAAPLLRFSCRPGYYRWFFRRATSYSVTVPLISFATASSAARVGLSLASMKITPSGPRSLAADAVAGSAEKSRLFT